MFIKRFKRKCDVRGCKNTSDVYLISKRREMGNTIAMCRDCMKEALASTENYVEQVKAKKVEKPLFPHPELKAARTPAAVVPEPEKVVGETAEEVLVSAVEDTTAAEEPIIETAKPDVVMPSEVTQTSSKKKTNKKK